MKCSLSQKELAELRINLINMKNNILVKNQNKQKERKGQKQQFIDYRTFPELLYLLLSIVSLCSFFKY
ncbi:unnamed protein product [Schistosoma rodhaini]|nr:unnamed protein product [Schistosoma rodhaini]